MTFFEPQQQAMVVVPMAMSVSMPMEDVHASDNTIQIAASNTMDENAIQLDQKVFQDVPVLFEQDHIQASKMVMEKYLFQGDL